MDHIRTRSSGPRREPKPSSFESHRETNRVPMSYWYIKAGILRIAKRTAYIMHILCIMYDPISCIIVHLIYIICIIPPGPNFQKSPSSEGRRRSATSSFGVPARGPWSRTATRRTPKNTLNTLLKSYEPYKATLNPVSPYK